MTHAQAAAQPVHQPAPLDTGQYTISVSKKGVGEEDGQTDDKLGLKVRFGKMTALSVPWPAQCRVDLCAAAGCYATANALFERIGEDWEEAIFSMPPVTLQPHSWIDVYLLNEGAPEDPQYALSVYLSVLADASTSVRCTYINPPTPHR